MFDDLLTSAGEPDRVEGMEVTMQIPDDIASRMSEAGGDLSRRALEAFALEELKAGRITEPELGRMLGLARLQIDGFLKTHGVYEDYTLEDLSRNGKLLKNWGSNPVRLVIADTGPVNYLILIGHIELLPHLFERVVLPSS